MRYWCLIVTLVCVLAGASAAAPAAPGAPDLARLTLQVDTETPYVQAQVLVTLTLERSVGDWPIRLILDSPLSGVDTNQAIVEHLKYRDTQHLVQRNGLRYLVTERQYALFPQSPGAMTVGPVTFEGRVAKPDGNLTFETTRSNAITLHVRPIPNNFTGQAWLPAKSVDIYQGFNPRKSKLVIGTPISRRLALTVHGAQSGALPAFSPSPRSGLQAHAFTPQRQESSTKTGLIATLEQKISLVPTKPGQVEIPTIEVPWWNTVTDREEIARFPGYTLTVTAAPAGWDAGNFPQQQPAGGASSETAAAKSLWPWWLLAGVSATALLALLGVSIGVGWRRWLRRSSPVPAAWVRWRLQRRALRACAANQPEQAAHAILRLAAAAGGPRSLAQLAADVPEPLRAELLTLNAAIYGPRQQAWRGQGLARALRRWIIPRVAHKSGARGNELPPLHPLASGRQANTGVESRPR